MHFKLGKRVRLISLDQHQIDRIKLCQQRRAAGFWSFDLVQQSPARAGGDEHLMGTGLAMPKAVLPGRSISKS